MRLTYVVSATGLVESSNIVPMRLIYGQTGLQSKTKHRKVDTDQLDVKTVTAPDKSEGKQARPAMLYPNVDGCY